MEALLNIFNQVNNILTIINKNGLVEFISPSVQNILGFSPENLSGQVWFETDLFITDSTREKYLFSKEIQSKTKERTFEKKVTDSKGNNRFIQWTISELDRERFLIIGNDITLAKQRELKLIRKNEELLLREREFSDSVNYAKRIQDAILQDPKKLSKLVGNGFVLYRPKDVVSGDFYWFAENENSIFIVAGDCTGHGIPGAMLTVLAINLLREIIQKREVTDPGKILNILDEEVIRSFRDENGHYKAKDGMDLALIRLDKNEPKMEYAAAFRPVGVVRNNEYIELKGERYPIGFFEDFNKDFVTRTFDIRENDSIYLFSDGYVDQFGGDRDKKFSKKKFRQLIESIQDLSIEEQAGFLEYSFRNWKQNTPQTDDVVLLGFLYKQESLKNSRFERV